MIKKFKNKQSRICFLVGLSITLLLFLSLEAHIFGFGSEMTQVGVYYFYNQSENEDLYWLEEEFAESACHALSKIDQISCIPLVEVNRIADYQQFGNIAEKKDSMLFAQLANLLQVDLLFSGRYFLESDNTLGLDLLMYSSSSDYLVEFRRMSASVDHLSEIKERMIRVILQEAGIDGSLVSIEIVENQIEEDFVETSIQIPESVLREDIVQPAIPVIQSQAPSLSLDYYNRAMELKEQAILEYGGIDFPSKPLWNEAIQNAQKAVELDPDFADGYYLLYEIYQRTKWIIRETESLEKYIKTIKRTGKQVDRQFFSESLTRLAHLKYNSGDTASAINNLEEAISYNPDNVDARTYLMRIYYDIGQGTKALQQAEEVKRIKPESIELDWLTRRTQRISLYGREAFENYENGYNSYIAKKYLEAIRYLEQAVRLAPSFKDAHYYLALSHYHHGNLDQAIYYWEESIRLDPFDNHSLIYINKALEEKEYGRETVWLFNQGYKHYVNGEYDEALRVFQSVTNMNPNFSKGRMYLMRTYYNLNLMDQYLAERKRIAESNAFTDNWQKEYYLLALDFFSIGEYEVALENLEEALGINPDDLDSRFLMAETLFELNRFDDSMSHYRYVIETKRQRLEVNHLDDALLGGGWCAYLIGDYGQSEEYLESLVQDFPKSALIQEGMYKLGKVYFIQEKYQEMIELYEKLQQLDSMNFDPVEIQYLLGQAYFFTDHYQQAKTFLKNIIDHHPEFSFYNETLYYFSFALFKEEKYQEAAQILEGLSGKEDTEIQQEAQYLLGRALLEMKEYERVIEINQKLLKANINGNILERVLFDLGLSYARNGENKQAVIYFQRVLNEFPQGSLIDLSRIELAQSYYDLEQYRDVLSVLGGLETKEAMGLKIDAAHKLGDDDLILKLYEESIKKYPEEESLTLEGYFASAKLKFDKGEYEGAIEQFKLIEEMNPEMEIAREIQYWLGLSYYRLRDFQQAQNYFQNIQSSSDDQSEITIRTLYMLAETYYQQEEFSQAIEYYERFLERYPTHSLAEHVYYNIGWSYLNQNHYSEALNIFDSFKERFPHSQFFEESEFLKGKVLFLLAQSGASQDQLKRFADDYPDSQFEEETLYIIAQINLEEQRWNDSHVYFEKLLGKYPESRFKEGSLYGLTLGYYKELDYAKALNYGNTYLDLFSDGSLWCDVLYITAICCEEMDDIVSARKKYEQIVSNCPDSLYIDSAVRQLEILKTP